MFTWANGMKQRSNRFKSRLCIGILLNRNMFHKQRHGFSMLYFFRRDWMELYQAYFNSKEICNSQKLLGWPFRFNSKVVLVHIQSIIQNVQWDFYIRKWARQPILTTAAKKQNMISVLNRQAILQRHNSSRIWVTKIDYFSFSDVFLYMYSMD